MNNIELQSRLLKLKGFLNELSHISYSFSQLNRSSPLGIANDETAVDLIKAYELLISDASLIIKNFEKYERPKSK